MDINNAVFSVLTIFVFLFCFFHFLLLFVLFVYFYFFYLPHKLACLEIQYFILYVKN